MKYLFQLKNGISILQGEKMFIIILLVLIIGFYLFQTEIYSRKCFDNVFLKVAFKDTGVFENDHTELIETVGNKKWLILWYLIVEFKTSKNLLFKGNSSVDVSVSDASYKKDLFSLSSYQMVKRRFDIVASRRGYYTIKKADLMTGDLFGKYRFLMDLPVSASLYVYPRLVSDTELSVPFRRMMGEILSKERLMEDPFLIRDIRDYMEYDSLKTINWNASAKSGELKVNEYDYTSSKEVKILLNIEKFNEWDGDGTIEEGIRIAATIAAECIKTGIPVQLDSNAGSLLSSGRITVEKSGSPDYTISFYRQLACIDTKNVLEPFAETLKEESLRLDKQPLYVLISQYFGKDLQDEVESFRQEGFNLYWIVPKYPDTKLKVDDESDMFVWEVTEK